jgi:hypothetical protein
MMCILSRQLAQMQADIRFTDKGNEEFFSEFCIEIANSGALDLYR